MARGIFALGLLPSEEAIVVRAGHPLTQDKVTKESLFEFSHVVVELTGTEEHTTDGFIREKGVARRVWIELDLPYTPKTVDIEMVCDQSADRDEGLQWLIDELAASMSGKI